MLSTREAHRKKAAFVPHLRIGRNGVHFALGYFCRIIAEKSNNVREFFKSRFYRRERSDKLAYDGINERAVASVIFFESFNITAQDARRGRSFW
jgi:hypothetical protein